MKILTKKDIISVYGNINIQTISKKSEEKKCISIENNKICDFGNTLYDYLEKEYKKINYDWMDNNVKIKTTKIVINNKTIKSNALINIYGKVIDRAGLPTEYGKEYKFCIQDVFIEDLFKEIEQLYDEYICDFDTVRDGLEFIFEKMEIR